MDVRGVATVILVFLTITLAEGQLVTTENPLMIKGVNIECSSGSIMVVIKTGHDFNGLIYPKGLSKNSSCMTEYIEETSPVKYRLPLRSCNTMSTDADDGIEYFNTVVVQPHRKLVTNQGRGYHIRCKYQTREKTIMTNFNVSMLGTTPLTATAPMPGCTMKIFYGASEDGRVAENVRIGDALTLVISIEEQAIYGMKVTDCLVRDGLGWKEQPLINKDGCAVDPEIMGGFEYSKSKTTAKVSFQAHKFPYTESVYYQCNVKLCINHAGGCDDVPPVCDSEGNNILKRKRRDTVTIEEDGTITSNNDVTIEVFSGLYVNEEDELLGDENARLRDRQEEEDNDVEKTGLAFDGDSFCISPRNFAIGIAIAGLILMLAVIAAVLVIMTRRHRKMDSSTTGSSIYSGPYSNAAFSHSS